MKIQPEFNIAAIISKMSAADLSSHQGNGELPAFATLFEAALQDIDDPQIAATLATLSQSGMNVPDSTTSTLSAEQDAEALGKQFADDAKSTQPEFRTVKLINGRSVITSPVDDADLQKFVSTTDFLSRVSDEQVVGPIIRRDVQSLSSTNIFNAEDNVVRPEQINTLDRTGVRPPNLTMLDDLTLNASALNASSLNQRALTQGRADAFTGQIASGQVPAGQIPTGQAPLSASTAQNLAAVSVNPAATSQQTQVQSEAQSATQSALTTPFLRTPMPSGKNNVYSEQLNMKDVDHGESTDDLIQRSILMRENLPPMMRAPNMAANMTDMAPHAGPITSYGSISAQPEISVLTGANPAPASATLATSAPEPASQASRVAERWMHIDDLGKQFNEVIKRTFLDTARGSLSSLRIMLYPENMGSVQAEIIDRNQSVTINLIVQNDEVARLLRDNSQSLRDALGNNNLFELNIQKGKEESDGRMAQDGKGSGDAQQATLANNDNQLGASNETGSPSMASPNALDTYV